MSVRYSHRILLPIAALTLYGLFINRAKAGDCQCGKVVIDKLWFATTSYPTSEVYPTSDVYTIGGEKLWLNVHTPVIQVRYRQKQTVWISKRLRIIQ